MTVLWKQIKGSLSNHDEDGSKNPHKFAYLTMKNSIFARFAGAFFIFWHFKDVLVLSTTLNDLFWSCVDDVSIWRQIFNFVFLCPPTKRWFQFNFRIVRTHFSSIMTLNNRKMIVETRSYIFRWRSRFRRRRVCLSSLFRQMHCLRDYLLRNSSWKIVLTLPKVSLCHSYQFTVAMLRVIQQHRTTNKSETQTYAIIWTIYR